MMKYGLTLAIATAAIGASPSFAKTKSYKNKTLTIGVIDTGIDGANLAHMCKYGHKDFAHVRFATPNPLIDSDGHGTHIAGIIENNAGAGNYCMVSIKFYDPKGTDSTLSMVQAIRHAINIKVDVINISAGGSKPSVLEKSLIQRAINLGIKVVVAAGNKGSNLDITCDYFPACHDSRLTVVGNLTPSGDLNLSSNLGSIVDEWEMGTDVVSTLPGGFTGKMTGTSQAAAIATGKLVKSLLK